MKTHQLSVFLENRPGALRQPCQALADAGLNILTLSLADTKEFGILHIIVREWEKAKRVLETAGKTVKVSEVVAVEAPDRPGGLADVLAALENGAVNVEYMYAFTFGSQGRAVFVFCFDEPERAIQVLCTAGIAVIGVTELYERAHA